MGHKMDYDRSLEATNKGVSQAFGMETDLHSVVSRFKMGASMEEGVSGRKPIDTTFENNRPIGKVSPRSSDVPAEDPKGDPYGENTHSPGHY